jgi:hypothetical protein
LTCLIACESVPASAAFIASYQFDGTGKDSAGAADATLIGSPQFVPTTSGNGLLTDTGRYAAIPAGAAFVPGLSSFSVTLRFNLGGPNPVVGWAPLLSFQGGDFTEGVLMSVHPESQSGDSLAILLDDGANRQELSYNHSASLLNSWHHAAYVVDRPNQGISLYLDGSRVVYESLTLGSIDSTFDLLIGQYDYTFARNGHPRFIGGDDLILDDVRIYDTALSDAEIAAIAGNVVPEPSSIVTCLPLLVFAGIARLRTRRRARLEALAQWP